MIPISDLSKRFEQCYAEGPQSYAFAPGRVNLLGEHVDYLGGLVLPAAIDKGITLVAAPSANGELEVNSLDFDASVCWPEEILDGDCPKGWQGYLWGCLYEWRERGGTWPAAKIALQSDLPVGAGLSSSAALEVVLLEFMSFRDQIEISREDLACLARKVENTHVGTQCGIMDHFASVSGREGQFLILDCEQLKAEWVDAGLDTCSWVLVNSMVEHDLGDNYNQIRAELESAASKLGPLKTLSRQELESGRTQLSESEYLRARYAIGEFERTRRFVEAMKNSDVENLGKFLQETHWGLARDLRVSTEQLDALITDAQEIPGWIGGRMMGGGFGGCTINLVEKDKLEDFKSAIASAFRARFQIEADMYDVKLSAGSRAGRIGSE